MEEGFIARLRAGDHFFFAGRLLEFVRVRDMVAYVRKATKKSRGTVPTWGGSKMALSAELSDAVREMMQAAARGDFLEPELEAARPMLRTQQRLSQIPTPDTLLLSQAESEVLGQELEIARLADTLARMRSRRLVSAPLRHPSPMSLPLMGERFREQLTTETLAARLERILKDAEAAP